MTYCSWSEQRAPHFQPSYSAKAEYPVRRDFAVLSPALWNTGRIRPVKPGDDGCRAVAASRRFLLRILDRAPDSLRGQGHVDMRDAVFGERIDRRVDDGGEA